jgi:hypothetical protein
MWVQIILKTISTLPTSTVQNKSWLSIWEWPSQVGIDVNQLTEEDYNKAIAQLKNEVQNYIRI